MVLCMSPDSLESDMVAKEWQYARQVGTRVMPVFAADVDFSTVPHWMSRAGWADFRPGADERDAVWGRFINQLRRDELIHKVPFMADDLPPYFVERPDEFEAMVNALVDQNGALAITAAVSGAGGFGKTTLALALCHDTRVRGAFDDGVLWVTLGDDPTETQLRDKALDLVELLTSKRPQVQDPQAVKTALRDAIGERYILLVIDDLWHKHDADIFLTDSPNSASVITTRYNHTLPETTRFRQDVDAMKTAQAVKLLTWQIELPSPTDETLKASFEALAARLGEWAVILRLANGQLRKQIERGKDLETALAWVDKALTRKGLGAFDPKDAKQREDAVSSTIQASLELLDDETVTQFARLAVFPEDAVVPFTTLERLWDLDDFDTEDAANAIYDAGLLRGYDLQEQTLQLHDVIRQFLIDTYKNDLKNWHGDLIDRYGAKTKLPDKYAWNHYTYHLLEAGRVDVLRGLFADQDWMNARVPHDGYTYNGYLADLNRIWEYAEQSVADDPALIGDIVRYALIRTSVNSLAYNYDPALVAAAIKHKDMPEWTPERGMSIAEKIPDPDRRDKMYLALLNGGKLNSRQVVKAAESIVERDQGIFKPHDLKRGIILIEVAPYLPKPKQDRFFPFVIESKIDSIHSIGARAMAAYVPYLPKPQRDKMSQKALKMALKTPSLHDRVYILVRIASHLPQPQQDDIFQQTLDAALAIKNKYELAQLLMQTVRYFPKSQHDNILQHVMDAVLTIDNEDQRRRLLAEISPYYPELGHGNLLQQLLKVALKINDDSLRSKIMFTYACHLPQSQQDNIFQQALQIVLNIDNNYVRAMRLVEIAPHLPQSQQDNIFQQALQITLTISEKDKRSKVLIAIAPHSPLQVLEATLAIKDEYVRVKVLVTIASHLPTEQQGHVIQQGLEAALSIRHRGVLASALVNILPHLPDEQQEQVLQVALAIKDETARAKLLVALASYLPQQALEVAVTIKDEAARAKLLITVAFHLSAEQQETVLQQALQVVLTIKDEYVRAKLLVTIAPHLPTEQQETVLQQTLEAALRIPGRFAEHKLVRVLVLLAPHLPQRTLEVALAIKDETATAKLLVALAPHLSTTDIHQMVVNQIRRLKNRQRSWVLNFCTEESLFNPDILPVEILQAIGHHVIEIAEWQWL